MSEAGLDQLEGLEKAAAPNALNLGEMLQMPKRIFQGVSRRE